MFLSKSATTARIMAIASTTAILVSTDALAEESERIVIPIAFSTPDTGFAGGAAIIWVTPNPEAGENKNDTARTFGFISQKGQVMLALSSSLYRSNGNLLLEPSISLGKSFDSSYGFGSDSKASSEEDYQSKFIDIRFKSGWSVLPDSYLGPQVQLKTLEYTDLSEATQLKRVLADNGESLDSLQVGLGIQLKRDTRDNSFYSQSGVFSEASLMRYDTSWGSDYDFTKFELEHRRFISLDTVSVLAFQGSIKAASGQVPFDSLPSLGGAQSLRGVLQDRYRDELALSGQVEWRRILNDSWGMAMFAGLGDVFPSADEMTASELKYAVGVGGRYSLSKEQRINLRLDLGYSDALGNAEADGFNIYFQVGEAF